jgi:hypothetical protein
MSFKEEPLRRALEYAKHNGLVVGKELGFGVHGIVFAMKSQPETDEPGAEPITGRQNTSGSAMSIFVSSKAASK